MKGSRGSGLQDDSAAASLRWSTERATSTTYVQMVCNRAVCQRTSFLVWPEHKLLAFFSPKQCSSLCQQDFNEWQIENQSPRTLPSCRIALDLVMPETVMDVNSIGSDRQEQAQIWISSEYEGIIAAGKISIKSRNRLANQADFLLKCCSKKIRI